MALWDRVAQFLSLEPMRTLTIDPFAPAPDLATQIATIQTRQYAARPWRMPSISEALGVPAIQRAVTLISTTAGSLSIEGYRNGQAMDEAPRVITRPDPYQTPRDFYRDSAWNMATRGEVVWWIATRDNNDKPSALIVVPLAELTVEENPSNRLRPKYRWGDVTSTRYSAANPDGAFVHVTYLKEPGALRGMGPLQIARAASSVSVEAQEWAANFYASGGQGGTILKSAVQLTEAESIALKGQWTNSPTNVPRVIDPSIEEVTTEDVNPQGAQMLDAREHQNGEAARMFGIPGKLLEYGIPGSSLTYQNLSEVWTDFLRGCLSPYYLVPIEQALTDLLPKPIVARFYVDGLLRADIKTRYEVYEKGIASGVLDTARAQRMEGIAPGSVEIAPVPFSPPAAVPSRIPRAASLDRAEVRCSGQIVSKGQPQVCNRLLSTAGSFTGMCPKCKKTYPEDAPRALTSPSTPAVHVHLPDVPS